MGCQALLQGVFPTWGSNLGLLHCRQILYCLNYWEACEVGRKDRVMFTPQHIWVPSAAITSWVSP